MEAPLTERPARPACLPKTWLRLAGALRERLAGTRIHKRVVVARGVERHGHDLSSEHAHTVYRSSCRKGTGRLSTRVSVKSLSWCITESSLSCDQVPPVA